MPELCQTTVEPGIYRCALCGTEVYVEAGAEFPSCGSQDHTPHWVLCDEKVLTAG